MPDLTITVSTGTLTRIIAAGQAAGFIDGPSYIKALVKTAVMAYYQGSAAAGAVITSNSTVAADFASTST